MCTSIALYHYPNMSLYGIYKFSFRFFQKAVILQGEIIRKKERNTSRLFFHEESIHEDSRRYLIPEYHSCKITVSKIYKKDNKSKISYDFFFNFSLKILFIIPYQLTQILKSTFNTFRNTAFTKFHPLFFKGS